MGGTMGLGKPTANAQTFLIGFDRHCRSGRPVVTAHTAADAGQSCDQIRDLLQARNVPGESKLVIKRHSERLLTRYKSLERFSSPFNHDEILYDPTGIFARSIGLVRFAVRLRKNQKQHIRGVYWQGHARTVYVWLDQRCRDELAGEEKYAGIVRFDTTARQVLAEECGISCSKFVRKVQFGFSSPCDEALPVDIASETRLSTRLKLGKKARTLSGAIAALGLLPAGAAFAQQADGNQAVSAVNGEIAAFSGDRDGDLAGFVEGAVTVPFANQFGARFDVMAGTSSDAFMVGGGIHIFMRDPELGLLGVAVGAVNTDRNTVNVPDQLTTVMGTEFELYKGQVTFAGFAGFQSTDEGGESGVVGRLDTEWYFHDNLMLSAGAETNPEHDILGRIGVEYQPDLEGLSGLTFFAEGAYGDDDFSRAYAGIRYYFGGSKSLKDRHRRDTFRSHLLPTRITDATPLYGD